MLKSTITTLVLLVSILSLEDLGLSASSVPKFVVDFDLDPSVRYNEVFDHFLTPLLDMETHFIHSIAVSK